jgi:hypothetical protein
VDGVPIPFFVHERETTFRTHHATNEAQVMRALKLGDLQDRAGLLHLVCNETLRRMFNNLEKSEVLVILDRAKVAGSVTRME